MQKPVERKGLLNPLFKYTRSEDTDIRRAFAREYQRLARLALTGGVIPLPIQPKKKES